MPNKEKSTTKDRRRNNEKRKEKSRDAARSRRSRETEIFTDLANVLPLSTEQVSQLDKASVMRLAISYLRVRDMVDLVSAIPETKIQSGLIAACDSVFLKSLEGFLVVMSAEGDFVFISENVSEYLGISQIDLLGQNVFEYSHPCDHDEIKEILSSKSKEESDMPKSFFIRLKCTLTSKGRSVNLKSATYKVIHCTGHIVQAKKDETTKGRLQRCLVAIGQPIPHPSNIEHPLPRQTFLTKHSLDMKFTHADDEIMLDILGYNSFDLVGKSVYEYHHAMDSESICSAFKCLFSKGQCETNRYRFLAKTGGYVWVLTQATLIYDNKMHKAQSVVCVNYVISGVEHKDEIYSLAQLASVKLEKPVDIDIDIELPVVEKVIDTQKSTPIHSPATSTTSSPPSSNPASPERKVTKPEKSFSPFLDGPGSLLPLTATSKIFAPRTEDMNKGFLMFSEEEPGLTMLKDEPDDLTHLAPVAGDVCVPLDDHPFLTDMLDDILLKDNFCPLLTDEPTDPFISYRDSYNPSPQLLSPNFSKNSECSLPSLNSPSDSLSDEDRMSTFMNLQMDEEPELVAKAPYIPMNMGDDLPLLMPDDLMWNNNNNNENNKKMHSDNNNSSLAQLLCTTLNKSIKSNNSGDGGGGGGGLTEQDYYEKNTEWVRKSPRERNKRTITTTNYQTTSKRSRHEPKEKMSPELLQQLMSTNQHRGRPKGKSNWLLDSGGQKAACISQPSDSVLMNLLDEPVVKQIEKEYDKPPPKLYQMIMSNEKRQQEDNLELERKKLMRKNSISLLNPEAGIPSLLDLTQQDYEVNAPTNNLILQGNELLSALDINGGAI